MFENFDWGGLIKAVAPNVISAVVGNNAANEAGQIASQTADSNRAVVQQQNDRAVGMLQPRIAGGQSGTDYFRNVMATNPTTLTPQQRIRLRDVQLNNNRSLPTALRGSGRASSAAVMDANNRAEAGMVQENQGRSDAAAGRIMGSGDAAMSQAAGITAGQAPQMVSINNNAGEDRATALESGTNATTSAIGNIAQYFADADKRAAVRGAYGAPNTSAGA